VLAADQPAGLTSDGHPWIGAENPELVITEFTDYLCFQCSKMNYHIRKLMARYPGKIKVIHRHFPMDHTVNPIVDQPVHTGAGSLALLAIYAETEGKFWLTNDYLFANARFTKSVDLQSLADELGLNYEKLSRALKNKVYRRKLQSDIRYGLKIGVKGTPTYLIDGKIYHGQIPPHILSLIGY
jgi:protein-disulfide isomerase